MENVSPAADRPGSRPPVTTAEGRVEVAQGEADSLEELTLWYVPGQLTSPPDCVAARREIPIRLADQAQAIAAVQSHLSIDPLEVTGCLQSVQMSLNLQRLLHHSNANFGEQDVALHDGPHPPRPIRARYLIGPEIGHGGMGLVYRGWDLQLERTVAIKITRDDQRGNRQHLLRFLREARIASRLRHPGILAIHDFDVEPSGSAYIIMDLISEKNLEQVMAESKDDVTHRQSMLTTFLQICQAIAFAHANGVVHRDLKPANIMVGAYGTATVLDWGLAKILNQGAIQAYDILDAPPHPITPGEWKECSHSPDSLVETQCGTILGTLQYLAPEQARGEEVDYRADVFSLGGILCHLLTGAPPFVANTFQEAYQQCIAGDVSQAIARLNQSGAPLSILNLAKRCLEPNAVERPSDAGVLVECLNQFLESGQRRAEEELVRFFDLSLDLFCIANTHGYFWRLNDNFQKSLGYTLQELTSRPFIEFVHPDDRPDTLCEIEKLARGQPAIQFINRYQHKNGHYVSLEWTARSIAQEGVVYAVARDISDRVRLEQEKLRVDADYFRLSEMVGSANDAIIGEDLEGTIQSWNAGAEALYGYAPEEIIGQSITRLLPPDRLDEETILLSKLRRGVRVEPFVTQRVHKSGQVFSVSLSISPLRDRSGEVVGASKIARGLLRPPKL